MSKQIEQAVRDRYGSFAQSSLSSDHEGVRTVAEAFGYSADELQSIPAEANMGLSCGNPTAYANLKPGEVVVDLGCGGGLDVFLAAPKVGPEGKAIGIDMTPEMIERARRNAEKSSVTNVEFHLSTIDKLPLETGSVDCVISNCVINLAPDKQAVFREIVRVLKPGGRLAVSDIALKKELPAEVSSDLLAYVGCVAGAVPIENYKRGLLEAGFEHVEIVDTKRDLNVYDQINTQESSCTSTPSLPVANTSCCAPSKKESAGDRLSDLLSHYNVNDYAASVRVYAVKPL
jgi:SAM-dependent methyltransferase